MEMSASDVSCLRKDNLSRVFWWSHCPQSCAAVTYTPAVLKRTVCRFLDPQAAARAAVVCQSWSSLLRQDERLWQRFCAEDLGLDSARSPGTDLALPSFKWARSLSA